MVRQPAGHHPWTRHDMRNEDPIVEFIRQSRIALLMLILVILIATLGYLYIGGENATFIDALYMTVITIATIGYGEIIDLSHSPGGRVFTMLVSIAGIGMLTYLLSTVTAFVVEGELNRGFKRRRMEKHISHLTDHYIVCGSDAAAGHVVRELRATQRNLVVVTYNREELERCFAEEDPPLYILGDATHDVTLMRAGIQRARGLFAVAHDDNLNVMILLTAKPLNPATRLVAHCADLENANKMRRVGADAVVSMEQIGGMRMASEMLRPTVVSFLDIMLRDKNNNLRIEEVPLPGVWEGRTVGELPLENHESLLLLAVKQESEGWHYNPKHDFVLPPRPILVFLCNPEDREALQREVDL